jgi:hypothetical protein
VPKCEAPGLPIFSGLIQTPAPGPPARPRRIHASHA